MKILNILNELNYSGAEVMLKHSASYFLDRGDHLYCLSTGLEAGVYAQKLRNAGYKIINIPFSKSLLYAYKVYSLLKQSQFAVIHIHAEQGFFLHAFLARVVKCKKIIRTVHSSFPFEGWLKARKKLERNIARIFFGVVYISISDSVKSNELEKFKNHTIPIFNWVDTNLFSPASDPEEKQRLRNKYKINMNDLVLISVGSCVELKNHSDIIYAIHNIINKIPELYYIHLGTGPLKIVEQALAEKLGINSRIFWHDNFDNPRELLVLSDIFVMPSDYEGLGLACLEAMCCGLPVLAYDVPGLRDLVNSEFNGLLVLPNSQALQEGLMQMCSSREKMNKMGYIGRKIVIESYCKEKSLTFLYKTYTN